MPAIFQNPIFSDDLVSSTELNRQTGRVLDKALERPVTITRNDQHFALLRRDEMSCHVKRATYSEIVFELLNTVFLLLNGNKMGCEHPYGWLSVFDSDELHQFVEEVVGTYRSVSLSEDKWEQLDTLIHEWHESAIAAISADLADAWSDETMEIPLTQPANVACS
jgi:hypothetical protein